MSGAPCAIEACEKARFGRGYCQMHYTRVRRYGDPHKTSRRVIRGDEVERFWGRVAKGDECWIWTGTPSDYGYGRHSINGSHVLAHRYSWELRGFEPLNGRSLDHICRHKMCVNPGHLRIVNASQNAQNLSGPRRDSSTGVRGVVLTGVTTKRGRPYRVVVTVDGVVHLGGRYHSLEEADEAAKQLRLSLFTHNELDRSAS